MEHERREESDQLPEEGPASQVPDDDNDPTPRDEAQESSGAADEDSAGDESTGSPDSAG